ncbi:MAG: GH92 family glycosyl hydrolase, partial [Bacteroidaceae bacterium]|nr:GH92 family glycosyl hydrolase [Bacteroidaceae bacterium]
MRLKTLFLPLLGLLAMSCDRQKEDVLDYVNPNLGTVHSRWFVYTPASEPFGLAKLGASTNGTYGNKDGWEAVGYEDGHNSIDGFPCLHEFQVGGVALMPITEEAKTRPGLLENPEEGWRSTFQKSDEVADAGYYSVVLQDYGVRAELTATARVGYQRYTFPASEDSHILLNIGNRQGESGAVRDARIEVVNPQTVQGYVVTEPEYVKKYQKGASVPMYFYACFDTPFETTSVAYQDSVWREGNMIQGPGALMLLNYKTTQGQQIVAKIGLSYTSVENARLNLETEAENLTFDEAQEQAQDKWREQLGRIRVQGGTQDSRVKFYTGLYHCLLGRGLASDVNGAYPRNDGTVGQIALGKDGKPVHNHYNTDAIWGGYWNLTPLWALAYPEYYSDFISSQLLVYQDAGWLGDGIACSKYVSGVGTNMVSIAMAGAYQSGIRNYDIEKAYEASLKNELEWQNRIEGAGKTDVGQFVKLGYVPFDTSIFYGTHPGGSQFSASHTLEYSFSAYAVAQWAKALGKDDDYARLMELSRGWEKLFNDSLKLIHPRNAEGQF